jgi:hypothetical protein
LTQWRPVVLHATREDAASLMDDITSISIEVAADPNARAEMYKRDLGSDVPWIAVVSRLRDVHLMVEIPLMQGWPFTVERTKELMLLDEIRGKDLLVALDAVYSIAIDCRPDVDEDGEEIDRTRMDAALDVCAMLACSPSEKLEPWRYADGHFVVDRCEDERGAICLYVLDPKVKGDDRRMEDALDPKADAVIMATDPLRMSVPRCRRGKGWTISQADRNEGTMASTADLDPIETMRRTERVRAMMAAAFGANDTEENRDA